jgi:hypothetical protein
MKIIRLIISKIWKKKQQINSQGFYSTDVWKTVADKYDIKNQLWIRAEQYINAGFMESGIIIYGEIYGPGIQGDKYSYGLDDIHFAGFDVEFNGKYFNEEQECVEFELLGLPQVPKLYKGKYDYDKIFNSFVKDNFIGNSKVPHEGCIVKSIDGNRHKISKIINSDYLIFGEKHLVPDSH